MYLLVLVTPDQHASTNKLNPTHTSYNSNYLRNFYFNRLASYLEYGTNYHLAIDLSLSLPTIKTIIMIYNYLHQHFIEYF